MAQTQDSRSNQKKPTGLGWGSKLKSFFFGKPSPDPQTLAGATAAVPRVGMEGAASSSSGLDGAQGNASQEEGGPMPDLCPPHLLGYELEPEDKSEALHVSFFFVIMPLENQS